MKLECIKQKIFEIKYGARRLPAKILDKIVWKVAYALPKQIAYIATIRVWAHGTTGEHSSTDATELTVSEMLTRWESSPL